MIFEPEHWEKPSPSEMLDFMDRPKTPGKPSGSMLVFRKQLSPLSVYKYLGARFGQPYGFQTMAKKPHDSDNLFHWDYLLKAGDAWLHIQGGNRDVHVAIFGKSMSSKNWVKFARALKGDFGRCGCGMASVGATLEKWSIVSNRFALIADTCAGFHEVLTDEQDPPDFTPGKRRSAAGIKRYNRHVEKIGKRADRVFSASLSLDLITPVLAEAFINLVIFMGRKDELKRNPRQYDHYIRQPIDTRVFDLHLKCNYFIAGVDPDCDEYKAFKRVMDRRNHNLHGNIDPGKDAIETVYFDKFTPLYERGADPILELFRNKEAVFDVAGVLARYHDVHTFLRYVLSLLEEKPRAEIELMMEESTFGYDISHERAGRLFPSHEVMMVMPLKYDDELNIDWR
ncbi:hypothetical protein HKX54_00010 [Sulfitobacter sp. M57]|uniref:hypothetical protein n=1 Tax=unclassified Sulfitobacter TaxID=196795 RepID=UPI0023E1F8C6|nr:MULTISPECIES: hypothetical protein [unclassified Sulfitobacter]MDF3412825.1 hypothetical protein [Sulfitobacter sp. KE5]MDF3421890.1 hypothetical protein [Sulfitobacter sp. KE43]MDF3431374.1 hypothetical protein [Sulfitobacter sp. KE42]MDF3457015.1 hypothetical protein [Sulfitobacter sp. S74]MDF3460918.1 hypothetical protein [Sulfitobacter sp. Ks18]